MSLSVPSRPVEPDELRSAMGRFATGVTVVSCLVGELDHAMTANSFASVSLDPPLVLVCVEVEARIHDAIIEAGEWGVSILAAEARGAATWLATRGRPLVGQLDAVPHRRGPVTGAVLLDHALAWLEVRTIAVHPGGDHSIVVGEVHRVEQAGDPGDALTYYRGRFGRMR